VCWGSNANGQLGDGTTTNRAAPVTVTGLTDAVEVRAGGSHTCARRATGATVCWGANAAGQLGDGSNTDRGTPVMVATIDDAIALDAGPSHTCAQRAIGQIVCWGDNAFGQLGDGTMMARNVPVTVAGLGNPVGGVWVGERHSCARRQGFASGVNVELVCWGDNSTGQLGIGNTTSTMGPQVVGSGLFNNITLVGVGARHACTQASTPGGGFSGCWGANTSGQVGDNSTTTRTSPTQLDPRRLN
jgi:alpha-tubulin suppressor-like RCC1 family protein